VIFRSGVGLSQYFFTSLEIFSVSLPNAVVILLVQLLSPVELTTCRALGIAVVILLVQLLSPVELTTCRALGMLILHDWVLTWLVDTLKFGTLTPPGRHSGNYICSVSLIMQIHIHDFYDCLLNKCTGTWRPPKSPFFQWKEWCTGKRLRCLPCTFCAKE